MTVNIRLMSWRGNQRCRVVQSARAPGLTTLSSLYVASDTSSTAHFYLFQPPTPGRKRAPSASEPRRLALDSPQHQDQPTTKTRWALEGEPRLHRLALPLSLSVRAVEGYVGLHLMLYKTGHRYDSFVRATQVLSSTRLYRHHAI